ncbi:MAG: radical SAM family heme chaperone HemW [bacterium]|nr:radical SAM family heme chaperone HemW [bacterium]MDE0602151.1 radical SAM family heme chaperone HemW [bacterium]
MKPGKAPLPPDDPGLADQAGGWRSVYLHIPFCEEVCPYCDFAVVAGRDQLASRYGEALVAEIRAATAWGPLDAVNFGGGTPSRMPAGLLERILQELSSRFGIRKGAEVSLEANPEDWTLQKAESLVAAGFNRVSLGAQSFDAEVLSYLGRRHTPAEIVGAVTAARRAGFDSVNLDLIMGSPPESASSWSETLRRALETNPDHLSTYALTVEPGTVLWKNVRAGACSPDPDRQAECWEEADRECARTGLVRYEVSNAARPGHHCRYNLSVWGQGEYLGFGNGAHSFRDGRRWENLRGLERYMDTVEAGRSPNRRFELIEGWAAETERVLLGIRRRAGVRSGRAGEALWKSPRGRELRRAGVIGLHGDRLVVERPLLTDEVSRAILALPQQESAGLGKVSGLGG